MVEYRLDVQDSPQPESRLVFLVKIEDFLRSLREKGIIECYALSTPHGSTCIFKSEAEGRG